MITSQIWTGLTGNSSHQVRFDIIGVLLHSPVGAADVETQISSTPGRGGGDGRAVLDGDAVSKALPWSSVGAILKVPCGRERVCAELLEEVGQDLETRVKVLIPIRKDGREGRGGVEAAEVVVSPDPDLLLVRRLTLGQLAGGLEKVDVFHLEK